MAKTFGAAGASVFIGGRRADKGEQVAKEIEGSKFHSVDVADKASNEAFFGAAKEFFGGPNVDFILLNAGVEGNSEETMIGNINVDTYDYIYNVNVRGVLLGLSYGADVLRNNGSFVVTSSTASILPFAGNPVYASSKAAVDSLVRSYAAQFAESDDERIKTLSVVAVNPGLYETELSTRFVGGNMDMAKGFAKMINPSQRVGKPEELAKIVLDFVGGGLPYKSGDMFVADADTHFPLSEYVDRMKTAQNAETQA